MISLRQRWRREWAGAVERGRQSMRERLLDVHEFRAQHIYSKACLLCPDFLFMCSLVCITLCTCGREKCFHLPEGTHSSRLFWKISLETFLESFSLRFHCYPDGLKKAFSCVHVSQFQWQFVFNAGREKRLCRAFAPFRSRRLCATMGESGKSGAVT